MHQHSEADIGNFYSNLREILCHILKDDTIIIMSDFNERVGCDDATWNPLGEHSVGKGNNNGLLFLQLCQEFDHALANTWFSQPEKFTGALGIGT